MTTKTKQPNPTKFHPNRGTKLQSIKGKVAISRDGKSRYLVTKTGAYVRIDN